MVNVTRRNMIIQQIAFREGAINTFRGGCANLASFDPKMLTPLNFDQSYSDRP